MSRTGNVALTVLWLYLEIEAEDMETIIGLLFILLPVVFKVIEKKLQKQLPKEDVIEPVQSEWMTQTEDSAGKEVFTKTEVSEKTVPSIEFKELPKAKPTIMKKALVEDVKPEEKKAKKKIDPKELVVYSELMKPKYQERDLV